MSVLRQSLDEYLTFRRAFGAKLRSAEFDLRSLVKFAEERGQKSINTDLVLAWSRRPGRVTALAGRLSTVRQFATWLRTKDPDTEIPPKGLFPCRYRRPSPFPFRGDDIERIVRCAAELYCPTGIRAMTYSTVIGLLANTGMRVQEAVHLDRDDVDLDEGVVTILETKFHKSRLVLIHPTTCAALHAYSRFRDEVHARPTTRAFFLSKKGKRVCIPAVQYNFNIVCKQVGLEQRDAGRPHPRLHDLRHHFAVQTLIDWYRTGVDVDCEIPKLATFLGHACIESTYWYLEAVPELLLAATQRLEAACDARRVHQ